MSDLTNFENYLREKRIDVDRFRATAPEEWERMASHFTALGSHAFDARKKFLINNIRLQFPLSAAD